jgi:formyl-CoA transferase/CoA:oxalate CoA-transferase
VIKVEEPETGDEARAWGPPFFGPGSDSAYFLSMNRHKQSVAVDLKAPAGRELCLALAAGADVLIENFRPGVAARLGLDYRALRARHPDLVYCSISAYGQEGPLAAEPGYDLILQGVGGLMSVTGEPGGRPLKAGVAEADIVAGTNAAVAILAALLGRERRRSAGGSREADGGEPTGTYLDVSLLDGQVSLMGYHLVSCLLSGRVPGPAGNALPYIVPYQAFSTASFEITVAVNNDRLWRAFCAALERPDLVADPRFATNGDRVRHRDALVPVLEGVFRTLPGEVWLERLQRAGVPAGPINTVDRVAAHPQVRARELLVEVDYHGEPVPSPTAPWRAGLPGERPSPGDARPSPPPLLGQHTAAVLGRVLGYSAAGIAALEAEGVIRCAPRGPGVIMQTEHAARAAGAPPVARPGPHGAPPARPAARQEEHEGT